MKSNKNIKYFLFGIFLGFLGMLGFHYPLPDSKNILFSSPVESLVNAKMISEKKIDHIDHQLKYRIKIYYPYTGSTVLNQTIEQFIEKQTTNFIKEITAYPALQNQFYTLNIQYDHYETKKYLSFLFEIFTDLGGAHPNTTFHTTVYDKEQQKIVTIKDLLLWDPHFLEIASLESRKILQDNPKFQNIQDMVLNGTKPTQQNFKNFVFTNDGILIFFENYQVAPYAYGSFQVLLPYSLFSNNKF